MGQSIMKAKLVLLLAAAAAAAQAPSVLESINTQLTADGLRADVSFLASDLLEGRGTPSRGLDLAAEYIAAEFRRGGLEPAGDEGYFQTANFASVTPNTDGLEFALEAGGTTFHPDRASITLQNAAAADLNRVPAVIADANALNNLSPEQVGGKVLVLVATDAPAGGGRAGNPGGGPEPLRDAVLK